MNVFEFGDAKLRAKDIDPLYRALVAQNWSREKLCRYTLAFVSFDLAGLACQVVDAGSRAADFWDAMHVAATQTKRGAPRRYFRGLAALEALRFLEEEYGTAFKALNALAGSFAQAEDTMREWPQFGPTAIFKLCDMAERVCGVPIDFSGVTPKQLMSNAMVTKGVEKALHASDWAGTLTLFKNMHSYRWTTKAPPHYDRKLNMQEFETILCYYSHDDGKNKHLPGMDIENIKAELAGWGKTAEALSCTL